MIRTQKHILIKLITIYLHTCMFIRIALWLANCPFDSLSVVWGLVRNTTLFLEPWLEASTWLEIPSSFDHHRFRNTAASFLEETTFSRCCLLATSSQFISINLLPTKHITLFVALLAIASSGGGRSSNKFHQPILLMVISWKFPCASHNRLIYYILYAAPLCSNG